MPELTCGAELVATLRALPPDLPAVAVLRHAARHPVTDLRSAPDVLLTDEGEQQARDLGAALPAGRPLRLLHSPIRRCGQTAEQIAAGYGANGHKPALLGEEPGLGVPYLLDLDLLVAEARRHDVQGFVRAWFDGRLPDGVVQDAPSAARDLAALAARELARTPAGGLSLLVSHDWNVLLLREPLLGVRHEDAGWLDYLDGVVFTREGADLRLRWRDEVTHLPFTGT